jgi:hypothetical protein
MRTIIAVCGIVTLCAGTAACQTEGDRVPDSQGQKQYFPTQEEAVRKARADLVSVLQSRADAQLGVDANAVQQAQAGVPVRRVDVDFARLLAADTAATFGQLIATERTTVVPLVAGGRVVTIVEVAQEQPGWRVVGLAGNDIAQDLTAVLTAAGDTAAATVVLYEVPNLQLRVYGVTRGGTETLFTDYKGRFTLRQGVPARALVPVLRADALEFQRVYGDSARAGRLLR